MPNPLSRHPLHSPPAHQEPGLALTAVISLALGIGATTAVFSVLYAAIIHPYPFREANRIMQLYVVDNGGHDRYKIDLNGPQIRQLRQSPAVDSLVAMDDWSMTLTGHELPENAGCHLAHSQRMGDFLGIPRLARPPDCRNRPTHPRDEVRNPSSSSATDFWQRHFASSPDCGRTDPRTQSQKLPHRGYRRPAFPLV